MDSKYADKLHEYIGFWLATNKYVGIDTGRKAVPVKNMWQGVILYSQSKRSAKPFVAIDCGTLSNDLAVSELFGHVKGAFTGAAGDKKGLFEIAEGGTLFLDEVGNLEL